MGQHWLDESFKHRRRQETHEVSFWNNNTACDEGAATMAVVEVKRGEYTSRMEIPWPEGRSKLASLEQMFQAVFETGRRTAKREIRDLLGCAPR